MPKPIQFAVWSVRQCAGNDGAKHVVYRVSDDAVFETVRRRDLAEDVAAALNAGNVEGVAMDATEFAEALAA